MDRDPAFQNRKYGNILFVLIGVAATMLVSIKCNSFQGDEGKSMIVQHAKPITVDTLAPSEPYDSVMTYIYNAPESEKDSRYEYHWVILRTALEKTKKKYGPYTMTTAPMMSEKRQLFELLNNTHALTVMFLDTKPYFEKNLLAIHIPVDKNFCGYRLLLIRKEDQAKFGRIKTLDDLKKITIGLGDGWIDVDILKSNGLNVMTGSSYEGLFKMLANKRFDAFSRSAVEILDEYHKRQTEFVDLKIEDSLLLYYPLPMYFWFSPKENGQLLAKRAKEGMEMMLNDGSYDDIFFKFHGSKTEKLHLKKRKIFRITNPYLISETPFWDKRLWYNPIDN